MPDVRVEAIADAAVRPGELFAVAADLRNLPAWWIEHLSAQVEVPAARLRDSVYRVRYRLPGGLVISALCTVVAARAARSVTYVWEGGGMRMAVGQSFAAHAGGTRTRLIADLATDRRLTPVGAVCTRLVGRGLEGELERALATLGELVGAGVVVRRTPLQGGTERRPPGARPAVSVLRRAPGAGGGGAAGAATSGLLDTRGAPRRGRGGAPAGAGRRGGTPAPAARRRRGLTLDPLEDADGGAGGTVDEKQKVARRRSADARPASPGAKRPKA
jgi:hypothetical protein